MNPSLILQGLTLANTMRSRLQDNQRDRDIKDYEELRAHAEEIADLRARVNAMAEGEAKDKVRAGLLEAGPVTQGAHLRVANLRAENNDTLANLASAAEDAAQEAQKRFKPFRKRAKKVSKRVQKRADQAAQKVTDKLTGKEAKRKQRRQTWGRVGIGVGITALIAALIGLFYAWFNRQKAEELSTPPSTTDLDEKDSTLVYSTTTEEAAGDLAEEPAERDEELLASLDEQLRANQEIHNATPEDDTK